MSVADAEAAVVEQWGNFDRGFLRAADDLIQGLLWKFDVERGPFARSTDGLLPQYEETAADVYFGTAILVLLPAHSVEPVSLNILVDLEARKLRAAKIQVGWQGWDTVFAGPKYKKMSGILAAMPRLEHDWLWTFTRAQENWSAESALAKRDSRLWPPTD